MHAAHDLFAALEIGFDGRVLGGQLPGLEDNIDADFGFDVRLPVCDSGPCQILRRGVATREDIAVCSGWLAR